MAIIGATTRTPAFSVSYSSSYWPANRETSVLVPPMSKPIARSKPAARATREKPTTPPAGPDRMLSLPVKASAATSPPADVSSLRSLPRSVRPSRAT